MLRLCTLTGRRISVCKVIAQVSEIPPNILLTKLHRRALKRAARGIEKDNNNLI